MEMLDRPIRPSYVTSDEMVCSSLLIMSRLLVNIMIVVKSIKKKIINKMFFCRNHTIRLASSMTAV